jgi:hypothetical protein
VQYLTTGFQRIPRYVEPLFGADEHICGAVHQYLMLKNVPLFMKASVENGTVVWPGNIDIAPETLWDCSRAA